MAPFASRNVSLALSALNDTVVIMQDPNGPWTMDLNTSVTIIFGILGLILQAGQMCYGRRQMVTRTRTSLQNEPAPRTEIVSNILDAPMSQRGQTRPSRGRGYSRSMRPQPWSPPVETLGTRNPRQLDGMFGSCTLPPPPDVIRRRHAPRYPNRGQLGGASGFSERARHLSQFNIDQNPHYLGQG